MENLLRPFELKEQLNISDKTYEALLKAGMPAVRLSAKGNRRFDLSKVMSWLKDRTESQNREDAEEGDKECTNRESVLENHFDSREHYEEAGK